MKKHAFPVVLFATVLNSQAFAGYTVCASENLYLSDSRRDLGMKPRSGTVLGKKIIAYKAEILVNHEFIQGLGGHTVIPYEMELTKAVVLENTGNETSGSKIYKATATLSKMKLSKAQKVTAEEVVCKTTWAMVP